MRLLDLVAQGARPPSVLPTGWSFPQAHHFSGMVEACPLRLVMSDDLTVCATQLAYADGDRLGSCLDLLHAPAQHTWVEWAEGVRCSILQRVSAFNVPRNPLWRRAGAVVSSEASGRSGVMRTFWSTARDEVLVCPLIGRFDFDQPIRPALDVHRIFEGGTIGVTLPEEPALDELLSHISYEFDPAWASYYHSGNLSFDERCAVVHHALGGTAFDLPMLCALFLLYGARGGLTRHEVDLDRLNASRTRVGKPLLLEHIEVHASLQGSSLSVSPANMSEGRRSPRLHHVRGHIARRGDKVFWKSPCLRGSAKYGVVRSRTVELRLG